MKISFIIPCYRSYKTIGGVCNEIIEQINLREGTEYEIITVNDCSPDNVIDKLYELAEKNTNIKVIDFAKNMGKHCALMAGFRYSTGDYVLCVDDDGQCPVEHMWELVDKLDEGYDVAMAQYGQKAQSGFKNFGSKMNNWMMEKFIQKPKDFQFSNFAAMKKFVIDEIVRYENPYAYVNGLILRTTQKIVNVPMKERAREIGKGGYTFKKSLALWIDGISAFSVKPLRYVNVLGIIFAIIGFLFALFIIIRKIINPAIYVGWTSIMSCLLILGGITLTALGLIGEYVGRIYMCINNSPQYVIRNTKNID